MAKRETFALYGGSFDPITLGHLNIIDKALQTFDHVRVSVGINPKKAGLFDMIDRVTLIKESLNHVYSGRDARSRLSVGYFTGSIVEEARTHGASHLVRGLRQVSDFNDEFTLNGVLHRMAPEIPVVHFICDEQFLHISSSTARELASLKEDLSWLATPNVCHALEDKF